MEASSRRKEPDSWKSDSQTPWACFFLSLFLKDWEQLFMARSISVSEVAGQWRELTTGVLTYPQALKSEPLIDPHSQPRGPPFLRSRDPASGNESKEGLEAAFVTGSHTEVEVECDSSRQVWDDRDHTLWWSICHTRLGAHFCGPFRMPISLINEGISRLSVSQYICCYIDWLGSAWKRVQNQSSTRDFSPI